MATPFPWFPCLLGLLAGACSEIAVPTLPHDVPSRPEDEPVSSTPSTRPPPGESTPYHIYVADRAGTSPRRLAYGHAPTWSPDGNRVAFQSPGGVYVLDVEGGVEQRLAGPDAWIPRWSPDGGRIAFITCVPNDNPGPFPMCDMEFRVVEADGSSERPLARTSHEGTVRPPEWSPDGTRLAIVRGNELGTDLYIVGADRGELTRITHVGDVTMAAWSPDGATIALAGGGGLSVIRPDGSGVRSLATNYGSRVVGAVAWSPRGDMIAFETRPDPHVDLIAPAPEAHTVDVISLDGEGRRVIAIDASGARWLPDGQHISYDRAYADETWIAQLQTGEHSRLVPGRSASWAPDGNRVIYVRQHR